VVNLLKRIFDIFLASILMIIFLPVILIVMVFSFFKLGRPIFFTQKRSGFNGVPFTIFKFRTMKHLVDDNDELLSDSERLTSYGEFLRSSSLDELPQLWNVIIGNMSIVGPRPLLMEYLPLYSAYQARRLEVRPGITGWAQIHGRNAINWDEKFALDVWYVDHQNLLLDLFIIFRTVRKVIVKDGITQECHATVSKFRGDRV